MTDDEEPYIRYMEFRKRPDTERLWRHKNSGKYYLENIPGQYLIPLTFYRHRVRREDSKTWTKFHAHGLWLLFFETK